MTDWKLRKLKDAELDGLYAAHIAQDFPSNERPSPAALHRHITGGVQTVWMMTNGERDAAYAVCTDANGAVLVTLLAVYPTMRGGGHGGTLLSLLQVQYADARGILLEVEAPEDATDAEDRVTRQRRIAFYERAGYRLLKGVSHISFGVRLLLMALPLKSAPDELRRCIVPDMQAAYHRLLPEALWGEVITREA